MTDVVEPTYASRPPPPYRERFPEGRDRLLALSENKPSEIGVVGGGGGGSSVVGSSIISSSKPPRMGLRANQKTSRSTSVLRPTAIYASEQSLPDRLTQALKGLSSSLRPTGVAHSASSSSPFKKFQQQSSSGMVAADDVVYFPSADLYRKRNTTSVIPASGSSCECVNSTVPAGRPTAETPPKIAHGVNSLDQLRQLYKSAPDFGSLTGATQASNDRTSSSVTKQNNRRSAYIASSLVAAPPPSPPQYANLNDLRMASTESFSAQSPTDSGYRSAPRHLDAEPTSNNSTGVDGQASLTTIVRVNGSPSQPQKLYNGSLDNTSSTRSSHSGVRLVHRQPTSASKVARKMRSNTAANGSLDTINTNVSLSEEFSLERCPKLIEVDRIPWNDRDVVAVLQRGRTKELVHRISVDVVPKLTYVLQRPLIRLSRELQRLSANYGKCTKHDVRTAVKIVLTGSTAESCVTAGIQATSLYAMSGAEALRQSQSRRANLRFSVGKFHRWMVDMQIAGCVSELAAVFMTAVVECLLEELVLACVPSSSSSTTATADGARSTVSATDLRDDDPMLNADSFDATLADSAQLWGVMQPYEHLISCRTANGVVCLPQAINNYSRNPWHGEAVSKTVEQCLLAMCVGSVPELGDLISRVARVDESKHKCSWDKEALEALFYFMRCSQLEHQQQQQQQNGQAPSMSFAHERPYTSLPPLIDWLRVSTAMCEHRMAKAVDADDVRQAARVLLPHMDCPARPLSFDETACDDAHKLKRDLAFKMLATARGDLVAQGLSLLGPLKHKATDSRGLTALSQAVLRGDDAAMHALVSAGADVNLGVPLQPDTDKWPALLVEFAGWTPLTWAVSQRNLTLVHALLDSCADVDDPNMVTETPLQLAAMMGQYDTAARLVACGADPFRSTISGEGDGYSFRRRGAPCALALAASHGHRLLMQMMLSKGHRNRADEPMSLKDFLAEGGQSPRRREQLNNMDSLSSSGSSPLPGLNLTKSQQRSLHEAMYYAAESGHLDIAVDLRNLGVGWNAHTWTQCLKAAHEQKRRTAVAALLADFGTRLADELTTDAIDDGVPLLFDILRVECKMADGDPTPCAAIVSRLYGRWDRRVDSALSSQSNPSGRAVIDPRYVNNSELSDVRFKIEGRIFYAHRIVLVNASSEFKQLLDEAHGDVELDDMNYQVFEMLMDYMYRGGAPMNLQHDSLSVQLQLLGAARRFGVHSLVRDCRVVVRDQLSDSNCLEVYRFAAQNFVDTLVADCETYLLENLPALVEDQNVRRAIYHSGRGGWPDLCGGLAARLAAALDVRLSSKRA